MRVLLPAAAAIVLLLAVTFPASPRLAGADAPPAAETPAAETPAAETPSAETPAEQPAEIDPLSVNAACYLCHIPFVTEWLGKVHLKAKVTCIKCHGLSAGHANDEDVGATKPDIFFSRKQVDAMCRECHDTHKASPRRIVARFVSRGLSPRSAVVCTDCHGKHKIAPPEEIAPQ